MGAEKKRPGLLGAFARYLVVSHNEKCSISFDTEHFADHQVFTQSEKAVFNASLNGRFLIISDAPLWQNFNIKIWGRRG